MIKPEDEQLILDAMKAAKAKGLGLCSGTFQLISSETEEMKACCPMTALFLAEGNEHPSANDVIMSAMRILGWSEYEVWNFISGYDGVGPDVANVNPTGNTYILGKKMRSIRDQI